MKINNKLYIFIITKIIMSYKKIYKKIQDMGGDINGSKNWSNKMWKFRNLTIN